MNLRPNGEKAAEVTTSGGVKRDKVKTKPKKDKNAQGSVGVQQTPSDEKVTRISHPGQNTTQIPRPVDLTTIVQFDNLGKSGASSNDKEWQGQRPLISDSKRLQAQ